MTGAPSLCCVDLAMSMVVPDETSTRAWSLLREFGRWGDFHGGFEGQPVRSSLLLGDAERMAGARRVLCLGSGGKLVEQLAGFDEDKQSLAFKLITHPANQNPFEAAFVNYCVRVRVRHSTLTAQSLVEVRASFMTDPPAAAAMHARLAALHEACLRGLAAALSPRAHTHLAELPHPQQQQQQQQLQQRAALKPVGSLDLYQSQASPRAAASRQTSAVFQEFLAAGRQDSGESARMYERFPSGH